MAVVGRILLGILVLLPVLLLLLLFFPISYRLEGKKTPDALSSKARVAWLFGLVRFLFFYPEPAKPVVKIAFFSLEPRGGKKRKKKKSRKRRKKAPSEKTAIAAEKKEHSSPGEKAPEENAPKKEKDDLEEKKERVAESVGAGGEETVFVRTDGAREQPEQSAKERREHAGRQKETGSGGGKKELPPLSDLRQKLRSEADFYLGLWGQEETKSLVSELFGRVLKILKSTFPRKVSGKLVFGAASPDVTGYVFAAYSILRTKFPRRLHMELIPDFQREILEGELLIAGHVTLFTVIWHGLRIFFDRRLRSLWREINEHRE